MHGERCSWEEYVHKTIQLSKNEKGWLLASMAQQINANTLEVFNFVSCVNRRKKN